MKRGGSTLGDPGPLLLLRQARRGRPTEKLLRLPAVRLQEGRTTSLRLGPPSGGARRSPELCLPRGAAGGGGKTSAQSEACSHPGRRRRPRRPQLVPWAGLPGAAGGAGGAGRGRRASRAGSERGHVSRPDAHSGTAATAPSCPTSWSRPQPSEARRHITLCGTRVRRGHDPLTSQVDETACLTGCDAGRVGLSGASSFPLCACAQHFNTDQGLAKEADAPVPRPRAR